MKRFLAALLAVVCLIPGAMANQDEANEVFSAIDQALGTRIRLGEVYCTEVDGVLYVAAAGEGLPKDWTLSVAAREEAQETVYVLLLRTDRADHRVLAQDMIDERTEYESEYAILSALVQVLSLEDDGADAVLAAIKLAVEQGFPPHYAYYAGDAVAGAADTPGWTVGEWEFGFYADEAIFAFSARKTR